MEIIKNPSDCFEFTVQIRRFIGGSPHLDALRRGVKDDTVTHVFGFAEKILRCLRCGPLGAPYRFGSAVGNTRDTSLAEFAASEGHVFIDTMELIAPNMFEIALGS
ncbi:MAG TPA: hypothetical protein VN846_00995 [Candidatus Cybelea sp.]|jgi:hypothetical protein|nr:hypothetical protein [Candidatus Cybelea sp.]